MNIPTVVVTRVPVKVTPNPNEDGDWIFTYNGIPYPDDQMLYFWFENTEHVIIDFHMETPDEPDRYKFAARFPPISVNMDNYAHYTTWDVNDDGQRATAVFRCPIFKENVGRNSEHSYATCKFCLVCLDQSQNDNILTSQDPKIGVGGTRG